MNEKNYKLSKQSFVIEKSKDHNPSLFLVKKDARAGAERTRLAVIICLSTLLTAVLFGAVISIIVLSYFYYIYLYPTSPEHFKRVPSAHFCTRCRLL